LLPSIYLLGHIWHNMHSIHHMQPVATNVWWSVFLSQGADTEDWPGAMAA